MKYAFVVETLTAAGLAAPSRQHLQLLVGSAAGKAFAEDLRWFAAGDTSRRPALDVVVRSLDPGMLQTLARAGLHADLAQLIELGKREGAHLYDAIRTLSNPQGKGVAQAYLASLGLRAAGIEPGRDSEPGSPPYYSFKIFGQAAALCITEARTRSSQQHTVQIEGAIALSGPGPRSFDWPNKIIVQLTVAECFQMLAALEHHVDAVRFDGHGRGHDKSLHLERQDTHYFVRMTQRGRGAVLVPVRPADSLPLVALLYKQILRNEPHLDVEAIRTMTQRMGAMMPN